MVDKKALANFKSNCREQAVASPIEPVVMYTCYGCGVEDGYGNDDTEIRRDRVVGSYISFNCKHCKKQNNFT